MKKEIIKQVVQRVNCYLNLILIEVTITSEILDLQAIKEN